MDNRNQQLCAWSGLFFLLLFFVGFCVLARFLPPPAPTLSAVEVAAIYQNNLWPIRLGMALLLLGAGFIAPWAAVITTQLQRIKGAQVLSYAQLAAGAAPIMLFTIVSTLWATAAFRPERNPDLVLLLHDLAWITLLTPIGAFIVQYLCIGIAILQDSQKTPVFPRWVAYFNFWVALLFVPGVLGFFFKHGPFAWDGLFVFWLPVGLFGAWYVVMLVMLLKAIRQQPEMA
jgi:hypothetical protein